MHIINTLKFIYDAQATEAKNIMETVNFLGLLTHRNFSSKGGNVGHRDVKGHRGYSVHEGNQILESTQIIEALQVLYDAQVI